MKYCDVCQSTYPSEFTTCPKDKAALHPLSEFRPGLVIREKYEILEKVGVGGMATVYRAKHVTFNEIKAIKIVSSKLMDDEVFLKRFKTEAIITRKLRHPNAVALEDFDTTADGRPFIVMEYVQGRNLRTLIHDVGAMPVPRAFNIAKQVASALGAAHKLNIVHRDIKPDNIIIIPQPDGSDSQDLVKVFDFGIAKMRGSGSDIATGTATQTGMVVGTPQYVSPEQASGKIGDSIDGRSDLYSLGVVLYEMVTGHLPFNSDTPVGFLIHHMQTAPTPPHALKPPVRLPENVSAVLMKALEKDRNQRFQNADEFIAALSKPHAVAAATAVMGSDALNAPTVRTPAGVRSSASHPSVRPAASHPPAAPRPVPIAAKQAAPPPDTDQTAETIYGGDETQYQRKYVPELPWKKIGIAAAVLLALVLGISVITNHSLSSSNPPAAQASAEDDALIKQQIEDAFAGSDSLKRQKISVEVQGGKVTLSGRVDRGYESEIANDLAKDISGVQGVKNDIVVQEAPEEHEQVWRSEAKRAAAAQAAPAQAAQNFQQTRQKIDPATRAQIRELNQHGYQALRNGNYANAERFFNNVLKLEPSNPVAQQGLRRAQKRAGR